MRCCDDGRTDCTQHGLDLVREGVLDKYEVELIAASRAPSHGEDRELFRNAMREIGLETPRSSIARSLEDALEIVSDTGYPAIIRPSFTMGGSGGGIAYNREEPKRSWRAARCSPTKEVLLEESVIAGKSSRWKWCGSQGQLHHHLPIENFDAMGVHTGDSITVAPALTLTDKNISACAMPPSRCCARSVSIPAARTCSSRSTRATAGCW